MTLLINKMKPYLSKKVLKTSSLFSKSVPTEIETKNLAVAPAIHATKKIFHLLKIKQVHPN